MTRIALKGLTGRRGARRARSDRTDALRATLGLGPSQISTAVIHVAALVASVAIIGANIASGVSGGLGPAALACAACLAILRVLTVEKRLTPSTLVLDAGGTVVLMLGTGAALSPFYPLAFAGIWWAAHLPVTRGAIISGTALAAIYVVLVVPASLGVGLAGEALGKAALLAVFGIAAGRLAGLDRGPSFPEASVRHEPMSALQPTIAEGLTRAVHPTVVPVDGLVAAGRAGLTAVQTELLAYLMLGLANLEIADAIGVSESTVRYRLTRLYQALGVRGRKAAAARGRELGLDRVLHPAGES